MAALLLAAFAASAEVAAECVCRGRNVVAAEGETVCLSTPAGPRLARCDKVLNNTSWTFRPGPCPIASRARDGRQARLPPAAPE